MGKTSPPGVDGYKRTSANMLLHTQVVLKVFFNIKLHICIYFFLIMRIH